VNHNGRKVKEGHHRGPHYKNGASRLRRPQRRRKRTAEGDNACSKNNLDWLKFKIETVDFRIANERLPVRGQKGREELKRRMVMQEKKLKSPAF